MQFCKRIDNFFIVSGGGGGMTRSIWVDQLGAAPLSPLSVSVASPCPGRGPEWCLRPMIPAPQKGKVLRPHDADRPIDSGLRLASRQRHRRISVSVLDIFNKS